MKVTLLGHASVFVEMGATRCLMDPVFQDPFEDTAVVSCPRREIILDAIPEVDLLVISHSHLDHFDIPSLAHVAKKSRNCEVLCPKDKPIIYALTKLGFTNIHPESSGVRFAFDKYELVTTHSFTKSIVEFGVIFKHETGTFWNQVDSLMLPDQVPKALEQSGPIDLLFAMYASQNFNFFESRGTGFAHDAHAMNLNNVLAIAPRLVVPGAAGFRFAGEGMDWCNAFLFPMSRERFVADLERVMPSIKSALANPGDVFVIENGTIEHHRASSPIARTIEDDSRLLRFDVTAPIPELMDPNPTGAKTEKLAASVDAAVEGFLEFVKTSFDTDAVLQEYRQCRAVYVVGVIFPEGPERWWKIDLSSGSPLVSRGQDDVPSSDAGHRIAASALGAWSAREKSYFYLRGFSRKWSTLYTLVENEGRAVVSKKEPKDLLAYYLEAKAPGAAVATKQWLDFQLKPFLGNNRP